jgi:hypothetical protein
MSEQITNKSAPRKQDDAVVRQIALIDADVCDRAERYAVYDLIHPPKHG